LATIWNVQNFAVDTMPPTYHMLVRLFDNLFAHSAVAARLPSALAMTAGLLLTFDCARRLTNGLHGLIALSFLTYSYLPSYGYEARSYGLYFMLTALALWLWTQTREENKFSALLIGVVFFLSAIIHYYTALCLVPYAIWEALNWKPWRLPSQKMIGAVLGVLGGIAVLSEPILAARHVYNGTLPGTPTVSFLSFAFSAMFPHGILLLALVMIWIALVGANARIVRLAPMPPGERIGWFFFLIPLAVFALAQITHGFRARYFICALPGIAIAFTCWLWRHFSEARRVSVGVLLLLAVFGITRQVSATRHPEQTLNDSRQTQMSIIEDTLRNEGKQFNVVCVQVLYLEAWYQSKSPNEYSLAIFSDKINPVHPEMLSFAQAHSELALSQYYPLQFWRMEDFKKHASEVALIGPLPSILEALKQAGLQPRVRFSGPLEVDYLEPAP
jgi:hypothetical protein